MKTVKKMRRSTLILLVSWLLLMVLYILVRPEPAQPAETPAPADTSQTSTEPR